MMIMTLLLMLLLLLLMLLLLPVSRPKSAVMYPSPESRKTPQQHRAVVDQPVSQFNQSIYLSRNAMHTAPDTEGGCNPR